jgi:SAM-dependent methyltransferase
MDHADIWDEAAARSYDTPGIGMFAPELLAATVKCLRSLANGGRALELAIGTGRVAVPLEEAGVRVAGIELSQPMIDQLRTKVDDQRLPVVLGDMTTAFVPGEFELAYLVFNGISNVLTQDAQIAVFSNVARHLVPGGRFLIELWVPDMQPRTLGPSASVFSAESGYLGVDMFDPVAQRVVSHHVHFDPASGSTATVFRSPHRYVWPAELDLMARLAGFSLESRNGGWNHEPFAANSRNHVSVYRLD